MAKGKKTLLMTAVIVLLLIAGSTAAVSASPSPLKVTAYPGVKITYNGQEVSGSNQPYIINNVTYVPFRLLMESFGKNVAWDAANYRVVITDGSTSSSKELALYNQIAGLQNQNAEQQKTISSLNTKIAALETAAAAADTSTSKIQAALENAFEDAGDNYFADDGITFSFNVSGDEDNLVYSIYMDFDKANDYTDITKVSSSKLESFLGAVNTKINSEIKNTAFRDAAITGKLIDNADSSHYVKYDGSSYTYSWSDDNLSDIQNSVSNYFADLGVGEYYFSDNGIVANISLSGDEDAIAYTVSLNCLYSNAGYTNISELSTSELKSLLSAINSRISSEISDTDFQNASLTGSAYDASNSTYNIQYNGSSYSFSW